MGRTIRWAVAAVALTSSACGRLGFDESETASVSDGGSPLVVTPSVTHTNLNSPITFTVEGGTPPYTFASDRGTIDASAGVLRTPGTPAEIVVSVTDAHDATTTVTVSCGGDFIYVAAGYDGAAHDEVWRGDGTQWTLAGTLPGPRVNGSLVIFDDALLFMGGFLDAPGGIQTRTVWRSTDGVVWVPIGDLPETGAAQAVAVFRDRIWLGGGVVSGSSYATSLWSSPDGATWQVESPIPIGTHGAVFVPHANQLWLVAGHEVGGLSAALWATSDGESWSDRGMVPVAGEYHGTVSHADRLWVAGGTGLGDRVVSTVDGSSWVEAAPLTTARTYLHLLSHQGKLWVVAGSSPTTLYSRDGTGWASTTPLPHQRTLTRAAQFTPR